MGSERFKWMIKSTSHWMNCSDFARLRKIYFQQIGSACCGGVGFGRWDGRFTRLQVRAPLVGSSEIPSSLITVRYNQIINN
jgi:hypothetical protein